MDSPLTSLPSKNMYFLQQIQKNRMISRTILHFMQLIRRLPPHFPGNRGEWLNLAVAFTCSMAIFPIFAKIPAGFAGSAAVRSLYLPQSPPIGCTREQNAENQTPSSVSPTQRPSILSQTGAFTSSLERDFEDILSATAKKSRASARLPSFQHERQSRQLHNKCAAFADHAFNI